MKTPLLLATATLASLISLASAQRPDRPQREGKDGPPTPPAPAEIAANLSERYAAMAAFDTNKSGSLDETEQAALTKAIEDGTLKLPRPGGPGPGPGGPRPGEKGPDHKRPEGKGPEDKRPEGKGPEGGKPPVPSPAAHAAKLYENLAAYDTDKAGSLDTTEQAAVAKAIEDGTLKLPRPGGPRGERPEGGPRGPRPDGERRGPRGPRPDAE